MKTSQKLNNKLSRLSNQSEFGYKNKPRHICKDGLPSLSHGRQKGCKNKSKLFEGESLICSTSVLLTESLMIYLGAKSKLLSKSKGDIIRELLLSCQNNEKRNGVDYVSMFHQLH